MQIFDVKRKILFQLNKLLRSAGVELLETETKMVTHLRQFLAFHQISTVIDVGANEGQFGAELRQAGFAGNIISIEPLEEAYQKLKHRAAMDDLWQCYRVALGDKDEELKLNVAKGTTYSSLLPVLNDTCLRDPNAQVERQEIVRSARLDDVWDEWGIPSGPVMLKLDTQGSEPAILRGSTRRLADIVAIQIELSASPLYQGQMPMEEMIQSLRAVEFAPFDIWPGFHDADSGRIMEYDGLFVRE